MFEKCGYARCKPECFQPVARGGSAVCPGCRRGRPKLASINRCDLRNPRNRAGRHSTNKRKIASPHPQVRAPGDAACENKTESDSPHASPSGLVRGLRFTQNMGRYVEFRRWCFCGQVPAGTCSLVAKIERPRPTGANFTMRKELHRHMHWRHGDNVFAEWSGNLFLENFTAIIMTPPMMAVTFSGRGASPHRR